MCKSMSAVNMIGAHARHLNTVALKFRRRGAEYGKDCDEKGGSKKVGQKNGFEKIRQENGREKIREETCKKISRENAAKENGR